VANQKKEPRSSGGDRRGSAPREVKVGKHLTFVFFVFNNNQSKRLLDASCIAETCRGSCPPKSSLNTLKRMEKW
jgi:hypothetical protein